MREEVVVLPNTTRILLNDECILEPIDFLMEIIVEPDFSANHYVWLPI
jgi:hypothetical protein